MHHSDLYAEMNSGMGCGVCSSTTLGHFAEDEESVSNSSPDCSMTGYNKNLRHSQERRRHRRNASVLVQWLETHPHNPYPTKQEKQQLAGMAGMTLRQLNDWFANARRNIKKMGFEVWRKRRNGVPGHKIYSNLKPQQDLTSDDGSPPPPPPPPAPLSVPPPNILSTEISTKKRYAIHHQPPPPANIGAVSIANFSQQQQLSPPPIAVPPRPTVPPQPTVPGMLPATQAIAPQGSSSKGTTVSNRSAVGIVSMSTGNTTSTTGVIAGSRTTPLPWFPSQQSTFLRATPAQQSNIHMTTIPIQTCQCAVCSRSKMGYVGPVPPAVVGCTPQPPQFNNQQPPPTTTNLPLTSIPWTSCTPPTFLGATGYQLSNPTTTGYTNHPSAGMDGNITSAKQRGIWNSQESLTDSSCASDYTQRLPPTPTLVAVTSDATELVSSSFGDNTEELSP